MPTEVINIATYVYSFKYTGIYGQLIYNKGDKNIWRKRVSLISGAGKSAEFHVKEWN